MNAERRPGDGTASDAAGGLHTKVRQTGDDAELRLGCPAGCGPVHECGVGEPIPDPPCSRRCQTLGVVELRLRGERAGGCVCVREAS